MIEALSKLPGRKAGHIKKGTAMNMIANPAASQAVQSNPLASRAMLADLTIKGWSARKLDRKVTDTATAAHHAASDAGRFNKSLIARDALAEIVTKSNAARSYHYGATLPWLDAGSRVLPAAIYLDYAAKMKEHSSEIADAVEKFLSNYSAYVEQARVSLADMFDAEDYPAADIVRKMFQVSVRIMPCPAAADFRVNLSAQQVAELQHDIEASTRAAIDAAMADVRARIIDNVGRMAERLKAFKPATDGQKAEGVFRDSLVENVRELARVLPAFNLTDDPVLTAIASRIDAELCTTDADILRESPNARDVVANAAQSILDQVNSYMA